MIQNVGEVYLYFFQRSKEYSTKEVMLLCALDYCRSKKTFSDKGLDSSMIKINRSSSGKPYFENLSDVGISISHSGKYIVCAVANGEIGVDIEQLSHRPFLSLTITNFRKFPAISDRFLAPSEKNARLMQGGRDWRSLLKGLNIEIIFQCSDMYSNHRFHKAFSILSALK